MQPDSATDIIRSILRPYMMITNVEYWIVLNEINRCMYVHLKNLFYIDVVTSIYVHG